MDESFIVALMAAILFQCADRYAEEDEDSIKDCVKLAKRLLAEARRS